ncbi:MAG: insulinase family protein [Bacteroidales bacterium]|nr:insulinase family protein [Candidatus Cryptobacteroides caccocaballi]
MKTGRAACGLQYGIRRSHSSAAYCALSIKCGTRDEAGYHSGIAHFVEHTLFKGTAHKSASVINGYLDRLGGELNAYTTKEEIVLHATVLKEDLKKAAGLLFELATEPTFPEKEISTEKGVVIDEIHSYKDSPSEDVYDKFEEMLFEGHSLSSPILGTAASVKKISSEELRAFVAEKFRPDRLAFTVVADEDEDKLERLILRLIEKYFPDAPVVEAGDPIVPEAYVRTSECFDKTVNKRNHQVNCVIGNTAPSLYEERERIAAVLLSNILGGPATNSILNSILREKNGWVYGVECTYTQYADTGIMAIYLGCDKENLDKCLAVIERETKRIQDEPMSPTKLKAAKKQLLGQLAISSDNGESQCLSMGKSLLSYGKVSSTGHNREIVEQVTAEELMSVARRIFGDGKTSRLIFL